MKKIAWLFPLVAVGCGQALSQQPMPTPPTPVVVDPFAPLVQACVDGAAPARQRKARRYCECVYREAAKRWTYEYFATHVARCEAELDEEVAERCEQETK